jgi:hypothetical protein
VVRSFHVLILMFLQGTIRLIVEPLDEPYEHICHIVECPTSLCEHKSGSERQSLCFSQVVHRGYVEGTSLGRKLLDLYVGNTAKSACRNGPFPQLFQVF